MCPDCAHLGNRPPSNPVHRNLLAASEQNARQYRERPEDEVFECRECGSVLFRNQTVGWVFAHVTWPTDSSVEALRRSA
jgi:hypothetical protein